MPSYHQFCFEQTSLISLVAFLPLASLSRRPTISPIGFGKSYQQLCRSGIELPCCHVAVDFGQYFPQIRLKSRSAFTAFKSVCLSSFVCRAQRFPSVTEQSFFIDGTRFCIEILSVWRSGYTVFLSMDSVKLQLAMSLVNVYPFLSCSILFGVGTARIARCFLLCTVLHYFS